jgi:predicted nucleic-acid-binding protein
MRAIDTNVLVRLLARDDETQVAVAEAFVQAGAWVPHLVLMETAWVLDTVYGVQPAAIALAFDALLEHQQLAVQDAPTVRLALDLYRNHPRLGFSDCLVAAVSQAAGHSPLGTFDRALSKLPGTQRLGPPTAA